jgi:3-methyladenine DNA glycosylase/8-oxoguanine DNA glycosylase
VAETLQRSHGSPDHISVGDYHLAGFVGQVLIGRRVDDLKMLELLQPFSDHRQRVIRLLQLSGQKKQSFGPRYAPLDHRGR